MGAILSSQVFGKIMAQQKHGVILNISSMNGFRLLTGIPAYSAAKAGVSNFTEWLAVHMAQEYSPLPGRGYRPRVLPDQQNRFLLTTQADWKPDPSGANPSFDHTPMGRFRHIVMTCWVQFCG